MFPTTTDERFFPKRHEGVARSTPSWEFVKESLVKASTPARVCGENGNMRFHSPTAPQTTGK